MSRVKWRESRKYITHNEDKEKEKEKEKKEKSKKAETVPEALEPVSRARRFRIGCTSRQTMLASRVHRY